MIVIVEGVGANVASLQYAFARLAKKTIVSSNINDILAASHVVIPGVSTAQRAMSFLQQKGLIETLRSLKQPVLGICSGMQVLFAQSAEGDVDCLGIFPEKIEKLTVESSQTLPHMGWNTLMIQAADCPLLKGIENKSYVYFIHSFAAPMTKHTTSSASYGQTFSAVVRKKNFFGTQFHPERSGKIGAKILYNFLQCDEGLNA